MFFFTNSIASYRFQTHVGELPYSVMAMTTCVQQHTFEQSGSITSVVQLRVAFAIHGQNGQRQQPKPLLNVQKGDF